MLKIENIVENENEIIFFLLILKSKLIVNRVDENKLTI